MDKKEYSEYLRSSHRKEFREEVVKERNRCQRCCKKEWLHVHHRNYECLRKEKFDDVIVLCGECHFRFHNKKKRKRIYRKWWSLDFTYARNQNADLYNRSNVLRKCSRCWEEHPLCYVLFKTWQKALAIMCSKSKPRTEFLKYEEIDVPIYNSRSLEKIIEWWWL